MTNVLMLTSMLTLLSLDLKKTQ
uniref:Uncharacterized protein n=1 Tax=Anguilla anguilla TaxID=7936 RepID=A0A0E9UJA6_ANGAN